MIDMDWTSFAVGFTFATFVLCVGIVCFLAYAAGLAVSDDGQ